MAFLTLIPAYGRDYKTAKAAKSDFLANKDFIIADLFNQWHGKPINREQFAQGDSAVIRFDNNRKTTTVKVS